MNIYKQFT